jgi:hypothetical protein
MSRGFLVYGLMVVALSGYASWKGWTLNSPKRGFIPQSVRQSPGGYRSYNYWRGGK